MIKRLLQSAYIRETSSLLTKEQEAAILHDIEFINLERMNLLLFILLIIELLFIGFVDIPNLTNSSINPTWSDKRYFILHLLLLVVAFVGIIIINIFKKNDSKPTKLYSIVNQGIMMVMLVLVGIINGLDQIEIGQTSSVFIANVLVCSATILIKFPVNLLIYFFPFSIFIGGILVFQKDTALLYSDIINGTIYFIAAIIISKIVYDSQYIQMSKNIMLEEVNHKLDYLSNHDPLTGLSNRRNFEVQIKQKMEFLKQHGGESALVLMDIDHFKNINDQFGHPIGDVIVKEVSNILLTSIKNSDLITRWGGEEFLILLDQTSIDEAWESVNKMRIAIEENIIIIDKFKINITASFGITQLNGTFMNSFDASYKLADKALYQAKNQGRNQVVVDSEP